MVRSSLFVLVVVAASLHPLGCANAPPGAPARPTTASEGTATPPASAATNPSSADAGGPLPKGTADTSGTPRERLMRAHFYEAALIRRAVIDGRLADTIAPADALAKTEGLGKIEPGWQSSIDVLQYAARRLQHGSDVPAAAAAIADIGIACGACHASAGGPHPKPSTPPPMDGSLATRMSRHTWATERLWEGIYAPSNASWKAGVDALSSDPFPKEILDRGDVHARSDAARFKSLVATAASKRTPQERGQLYASLLETCAACHVSTRK